MNDDDNPKRKPAASAAQQRPPMRYCITSDGCTVRLIESQRCSSCGRELQPFDLVLDHMTGRLELACTCGTIILDVRPPEPEGAAS